MAKVAAALRIIVDTREQRPWTFEGAEGVELVGGTLRAGDYSVEGAEELFAIERKGQGLGDLIGTLTFGRERFEHGELPRLAAMKRAAIVVEAPLSDLISWRFRSRVSPLAILNSLSSFHARYNIPTIWAGNRENAQHVALSLLQKWAKHIAPAPAEAAPSAAQ